MKKWIGPTELSETLIGAGSRVKGREGKHTASTGIFFKEFCLESKVKSWWGLWVDDKVFFFLFKDEEIYSCLCADLEDLEWSRRGKRDRESLSK